MGPLKAAAALILSALAAAACATPELSYDEEIAGWRAEKDQYMRSSESPVKEAERAAFPPLPYFDVNPEYRVPAALKPGAAEDILEMPTSTGQRRHMRRIGKLEFTVKGEPHTLTAFADASDTQLRRLFVPFFDLTNGTETYPGGRYLDLDRTASGVYDLDFNRAYNPFCLFNAEYDCPVPPRENRLPIPIRAGEKLGSPK
jgi:uncharacterized protein (DUF1684 family)